MDCYEVQGFGFPGKVMRQTGEGRTLPGNETGRMVMREGTTKDTKSTKTLPANGKEGKIEALQTNSNPEIRRLIPRQIFLASLALKGAYGLFLDDLFHGASEFAAPYRSLDDVALVQRLWKHWQERGNKLGPGDEYRLVDEFADRRRVGLLWSSRLFHWGLETNQSMG
jgi:hypothetical protein